MVQIPREYLHFVCGYRRCGIWLAVVAGPPRSQKRDLGYPNFELWRADIGGTWLFMTAVEVDEVGGGGVVVEFGFGGGF